MKIIFFGTDNFAAHILNVLQQHHEVVAVVTVPDALVGRKQVMRETPVAALSKQLGVETLKPTTLRNSSLLVSKLESFNSDVFVVTVYSKIIPQNILAIPPKGNINVHPSLLPLYRGPAPIRTPLLNGDKKTGVSIMLMDDSVDHGPLLAVEEVNIAEFDTNTTLTEKLSAAAAPLLVKTLANYEEGKITPTPQDHSLATFTKLVSKEDGRIDWTKEAQKIYNQWRAMQGWPGIFTTWKGKLLKIDECLPVIGRQTTSDEAEAAPGTVYSGGIVVCGAETYLQIKKSQLEGRQVVDIKEFINGHKDFVGSKFEKRSDNLF